MAKAVHMAAMPTMASRNLNAAGGADQLVCDFCDAPTASRHLVAFPCADYEYRIVIRGRSALQETCHCHTPIATEPGDQVLEQHAIGAWLACPRCAELIRANDRSGLARRSAATAPHGVQPLPGVFVADSDEPSDVTPDQMLSVEEQAAHGQLRFWLHRLLE